ncbi:MAG: hypothetical protein PHC54_02960 [Candidatus Omnitrophica bacterium]|nr:hypothetical protein [Candidatus Omnitrophota bacterium]MDD5592165.1 hypothetical protein [Candidatus Omnitrophota bacterium]
MGIIFQFIFISYLVTIFLIDKFNWGKYYILNLLFFAAALFFPKQILGMYGKGGGRIETFVFVTYTFFIFYMLPSFCILRARKLLKVKINFAIDFIIQCFAFFILWLFFYIILLFLPISRWSIKTTGVGP